MDRDELLATMYSDDDQVKNLPNPIERNTHTRKIRVGVVEYEVPTVEYVRHLEQIITRQTQMLEQHRRAIDRMATMMHGTRNFVRRHTDALADIRFDLTNKVDSRA